MKSFLKKRVSSHVFSISGIISGLIVLFIFTSKPGNRMSRYRLLCLGDSYTIGEMVLSTENFPNQTVNLLRQSGHEFENPEIVARTGWTTDELQAAIKHHRFQDSYDFVTLLIGVNNQYRGEVVEDYKPQFELLLKQAITFAKGKNDHVIVLSIPDWSVTPFAKDRDRNKIAAEIDNYNQANKNIALAYHVHYIDITPGTKEAIHDKTLIAPDSLHPSAKEYARWVEKIYEVIHRELQ